MVASRWGGVVGVVALMVCSAACSSDSSGPKAVKTADAYSAAIRWYLAANAGTATTTSSSGRPLVVYVAPESGKAISSQTQASVVKDMSTMSEVVTVRFADVRDEVLETDIDDLPVKDGAVLLLVGEVHEAAPPVDVTVDVYRSVNDSHEYTMTITGSGDLFEATRVSEVAQG
ncbi:MAG: hypothetical protein JWL72_3905 [Ilumatobacteraceae bacterium]|nr:hypothetical protein [Ilumatobacteraceae bacterium]